MTEELAEPVWKQIHNEPSADVEDIGPQVLATLREKLLMDDEWVVEEPRALVWWGAPAPMRIEVSEPREVLGDPLVKITATCQLLEAMNADPTTTWRALSEHAGSGTSGWAYWTDPDAESLHVSTTHYAHPGNQILLERNTFAALALTGYQTWRTADYWSERLGGDPVQPPHPDTGLRFDEDELLGFPGAMYQAGLTQPNPWEQEDFGAVSAYFGSQGLLSTHGPDGCTVEFPFTSEIPASAQAGLGFSDGGLTSLGQILVGHNQENTPGLLITLDLPEDWDEAEVLRLANDLNRAEATELTGFPGWGAWVCRDDGLLRHVSHVPGALRIPGMSQTLGFYMGMRAGWVQGRLVGG